MTHPGKDLAVNGPTVRRGLSFEFMDPPPGPSVAELVAAEVEKVKGEIVASYLPTLDPPVDIVYQTRRPNGFWEDNTPMEAVTLHGKGREMQVILRWRGVPQ